MTKKLVIAGLPLRLRATLHRHFPTLEISIAADAPEVFRLLEDETVAGLVIDESLVDSPQQFFVDLDLAFLGSVIFLAKGPHRADEIRDLVERGSHSVVLHHPLDPDELLRRVASQLDLALSPSTPSSTHLQDDDLAEVWNGNREVLEGRLDLVRQAAHKTELSAEELDEAWRAAFQLAGTLGSFGVHRGSSLAREAHQVLKAAQDGPDRLDTVRLKQVVEVLTTMVSEHGHDQETRKRDGTILLVGDDETFAHDLAVEALLLNWSVLAVHTRPEVLQHLIDPLTLAVAVDLESELAKSDADLIEDLLKDGIPCLVLSHDPYEIPPQSAHLSYLAKPAPAYRALTTLLRSQTPPAPEHPPAILVVDDDPIILLVISATLGKADMDVLSLENPLEFWDRLAQDIPDLIILDIDLPPLGGLELCRALRNSPQYAALPVMFMSSYNDSDTLRKAFEAGADDYLYKPVSAQDLLTRVQNRLQRTRQVAMHPFPLHRSQEPEANFKLRLVETLREKDTMVVASLSTPSQLVPRLMRTLRRTLRPQDLVRRLADDEVLVGLPGVSKAAAREHLAHLLKWEGEHAWTGIAEGPADGTDLPRLIEAARGYREASLPAIQVTVLNPPPAYAQ